MVARDGVAAGGDTDSIGAIMGAWRGARHGVRWIPRAILDDLDHGPVGPTHLAALADDLAPGHRGGLVRGPTARRDIRDTSRAPTMTTPALDSLIESIRAIPSLAARLSALDRAYEALSHERDAQMHAWGVVAHREAARAAIDRWKARPDTMFPDDFDGECWVFPVLPPEHGAAIEALWRDTVIDEFALYLRRDGCDVLTTMRGTVRGVPVDFGWSYTGGDHGAGGSSCVTFGERPGNHMVYGAAGFLEAARAFAGELPEALMCAYLYLIGFDHISPGESFHSPQYWHDSELRELAVAWNAQHGVVAPFG